MQPKLSVCLITYNHEAFITQALDGILMQQCTFDWDVVVADDKSKDNTAAIINEYAAKHPDRIRVNKRDTNVGMTVNWLTNIAACEGEYIALLEGDDYWTDPLKLQKQVDLLDKQQHLSFACHDVETIFEPGIAAIDYMSHPGVSREYTIEDVLNWKDNFFVPTGSVVFRRSMLIQYPEWANKDLKYCIDLITELMLSMKGPFFYINEKMGKYRLHLGGVSQINWLGKEHLFEFDMIHVLTLFDSFSGYKYTAGITDKLAWLYLKLLKKNPLDSPAYRKALFGLLRVKPGKNLGLLKIWVIHNYLPPSVYRLYKRVF
jgi:glycosyltransferase involved in cell wall biosynthesis